MSLTEKINRANFWLLYGIMAFMVIFQYIYSRYFIDFPKLKEANPIVHFLALRFSQTFNTPYENYYIYCLPLVLLLFYGAGKFAKWLIPIVDKKSNIRGDNHVILFISFLTFPNFLHQLVVVLTGFYLIDNYMAEFKYTTIAGFFLAFVYMAAVEIDDWRSRSKKF